MEKEDFLVRCSPRQFLEQFLPLPLNYPQGSELLRAQAVAQESLLSESLFDLLEAHDAYPDLEFHALEGLFPRFAGYPVSRTSPNQGPKDCYNEAEIVIESTLAMHREPSLKDALAALKFMEELFAHQHRTHFFSVHIHQNNFRFARWDRAAIVVTEIVDASSSAPLLIEFFRRFDLLDPEARGHDTSAVRATEAEQDILKNNVEQINREHGYLRGSAQTMGKAFLPYKLRVDPYNGGDPQYYIVQGPCTRSEDFIGPTMRGYWAWSLSREELVFLKDAWGLVPQAATPPRAVGGLCALHSNGLPAMPQIHGIGHVPDSQSHPQMSLALYLDRGLWEGARGDWLEHYRAVQEFSVNLDLKELCKPQQIVQAIRDTLLVIEHAHTRGGILHTNITPDNIMYNPKTQRSFLVNWDLATHRKFLFDYKPKRSAYQSIWSHLDTRRMYQIQDDVESCFWSLLDIALACGGPSWGAEREGWRKAFENVFNPTCHATNKIETLLGLDLDHLEFSSPALTAVIRGFAAKVRKMYDVPGVDLRKLTYAEKLRALTAYYWQFPAEKELAEIWPIVTMLDELLHQGEWEETRNTFPAYY